MTNILLAEIDVLYQKNNAIKKLAQELQYNKAYSKEWALDKIIEACDSNFDCTKQEFVRKDCHEENK